MPDDPTREELLAQVAALQLQLSSAAFSSPPHATSIATSEQPFAVAHPATGTPEQILAQITALRSVIYSGVNSAGYGDKRTDFRSLIELRQILNGLEGDLADALGMGGRVRQIRMTTAADKGL